MFRNLLKKLCPRRAKMYKKYSGDCHPVDPNDPNTKITILLNGIRIATEETQSPLACVSLFAEAGSRFEIPAHNGAINFIEHMAFNGFKSINKCEIEDKLSQMGVRIDADTNREVQRFSAICPPEAVKEMVAFLCRIITDLALQDEEIEMVKQDMCYEVVDADNDPKVVMFDYLHQTAFQGTPLAQTVMGPTKNIRKFDSQFLSCFVPDYYQPYKLCFGTSGNVKHEEIVEIIQSILGGMVGDAARESEKGPCRFTGSQIMYRNDSMPYAHVAIAFEVPGYGHPDHLTLFTMCCMMGSFHKSQGRGNNNAPTLACAAASGLCESYEPFYIPYSDVGLWGIYYVGQPLLLEDMLNNIQGYWMQMCVSCNTTDVQRAVNLAKLKFARRYDGAINSSHDIGNQMLYSCVRKPLSAFFEELSSVKTHAVRECGDKYLYDRCPAVACVGPIEGLPDYTKIRAGQYWLRF